MRAYPDGHTGDSLMALWFAYSESRDYFSNKMVIPTLGSIESKTPTRKEGENEADQKQILDQEIPRGRYSDPKAFYKQKQLEAKERTREAWRSISLGLLRKREQGYRWH